MSPRQSSELSSTAPHYPISPVAALMRVIARNWHDNMKVTLSSPHLSFWSEYTAPCLKLSGQLISIRPQWDISHTCTQVMMMMVPWPCGVKTFIVDLLHSSVQPPCGWGEFHVLAWRDIKVHCYLLQGLNTQNHWHNDWNVPYLYYIISLYANTSLLRLQIKLFEEEVHLSVCFNDTSETFYGFHFNLLYIASDRMYDRSLYTPWFDCYNIPLDWLLSISKSTVAGKTTTQGPSGLHHLFILSLKLGSGYQLFHPF